jgi:methyl-accepting chemotaxis protein
MANPAGQSEQANTLVDEANSLADKGNQSMRKMSTAINDLPKSSDETAKIMKVIDDIAFRTNLLALNATVEAVGAGEVGNGFAVVVEEVRNLAMCSAEAAKNIANMIEKSVKNGVETDNEVGKVLEKITAAASEVNDIVGNMAAASWEQAQGID